MANQRSIRVLVTGGPTRAYLDKVRYLSNYSTGEMAFAICRALLRQKMKVAVVSGPTTQPWDKLSLARCAKVETFEEMRETVLINCERFRPDVAVFAAAVLDFSPGSIEKEKVSSSRKTWTIRLVPNPKIIDEVGKKFPLIKRIGFKLEWDRPSDKTVRQMGEAYLKRKQLKALILNFLSEIGTKGHPTYLFTPEGLVDRVETKNETASWIAQYIRVIAETPRLRLG